MENNNKIVKALGFMIMAYIFNILSEPLSMWQESVFHLANYIFYAIGLFQLSKAFEGKLSSAFMIYFVLHLIVTPISRILVSDFLANLFLANLTIDNSIFTYIYYYSYFTGSIIELIAILFWIRSISDKKTKIAVLVLFFITLFWIVTTILFYFFNINIYNKIASYAIGFIWFLCLVIAQRGYSHNKNITTAIMLSSVGAALGIFIVLGDGIITEYCALVGYIILLVSLSSLSRNSLKQIDTRRLRAAAIVAIIAMFINTIPFLEFLGTIIEFVAYGIAISGYRKMNRSNYIDTKKSGFIGNSVAMIFLILATILHAVPSMGIGEALAAILGLIIVIILSSGWLKALIAIDLTKEPQSEIPLPSAKEPSKNHWEEDLE